MVAFAIRELLASVNEFAKNCHGIIPAETSKRYGTPSDGSLASLPKIIVKTKIVISGRMILHKTPSTVCL